MAMFPLVLALSACREPVEAPADLDGLVRFFWAEYDGGSDEALRVAASNLDAIFADGKGTVGALSDAEAAVVEVDGAPDLALAHGLYVSRALACDLAPLEEILYDLDQEGIYEAATGEEAYDAYDRAYTTDLDAYVAREAPQVAWDVTYVAPDSMLPRYTARVLGGLRWVPAPAEGEAGIGPVLLARTWMPAPAVFDEGSHRFDQDYQVEVYWARDGQTAHLYGMWRELEYFGMTLENDGVKSLILDGLYDFDDDTEAVCAGW